MDDVKRYEIDGREWELLEDSNGDYVAFSDFDAQRLRADTAEAERNQLLNDPNNVFKKMCDMALKQRDETLSKLAAAEQRIVELMQFLTTMTMPIVDDEKFCIERILVFDNAKAYLSIFNPNPDAPKQVCDICKGTGGVPLLRCPKGCIPEAESHE